MFRNSLSKYGRDAALGVKRNGEWVTWTYEDYWCDARRAARDAPARTGPPFYRHGKVPQCPIFLTATDHLHIVWSQWDSHRGMISKFWSWDWDT